MSSNTITVSQHYALGQEELFALFAEHDNMGTVFAPAKIRHTKDGHDERSGVGSKRIIKAGPGLAFEETVTVFERPSLIQYTISKGGGPMSHHLGTLRFTPAPSGGTDLVYSIELGSRLPGAAFLVNRILKAQLKAGLPKIAS